MEMADRPNVVWVFLDQCRADVLGCYGHPFVQTPNLDRLAVGGVLFENAFCQNPVCVPSRASMLSGTYSHQTGVYDNGGGMRPGDSRLLAGFRAAGYHTVSVGKVHLGITPEQAGFDEHRDIRHDGIPHFRVPDDYPEDWAWRRFDAPGFPQPVIYAADMCPRERSYCAVGVTEAIDLFHQCTAGDSPLLLRLSLDRPHTPVTSPEPYASMYADRTELPDYPERERREQIGTLQTLIHRRRWDRFTPDEIRKIRHHYYGLVTHVDAELGRLLAEIENSRAGGKTIVVLTVDHGCMLGEHGLYVKGAHYHTETARVPFLLSAPGRLPGGRRVSGLVEMVDLLPTLCDLCTLPTPAEAVGRSLLPLARGQAPGRSEVFAEQYEPDSPRHWQAARSERYVYTRYSNTGEETLFDVIEDPHEQRNLMLEDPPAQVVRNLNARIDARLEL
jgi:arylsulfatase A-like enzyme